MNKPYIDANIGGGGYSDTEIDKLLALRVPVSDFTNRFSANPIIDCSAPTVIHSGLTLNNSTINISPVAGLSFSNQTGGGDKVLAEFKNATSYITLQGDKIFCNNTSADAIKQLDLTNNGAGYKMSGKIEAPTGLTVENTTDGNLSFTVRNTDNYITFNNDSIDSYNVSGDTGRILNLNKNANEYVKSHNLLVDPLSNTITSGYEFDVAGNAIIRQNLRVSNLIEFADTNTTLERYANATKVNTSLDIRTDEDTIRLMTGASTDADTNTHIECDKANDKTIFYKDTDFRGNLDLTSSTGDILRPTAGFDMFRNGGDANYNLRIRDTQRVFEFKNRQFRCMNPSNPANGTEFILHDTGGDYRMRIGSISTATLGIGRQYNASYHLTVGGTSNFNETRVENDATFLGQQLLYDKSRVFQRADANNSLNIIGEKEINFSLQTDRTLDPTTGSIALQLNDNPSSITMNRATTMNQTLNVIGTTTAENGINVWGDLNFQHSSGIKETLNGTDYDLDIRNGDTDRAINFIIGTIGSTPELTLSEGKLNLLGNLEITHTDVSGSQRVLINNPDTDGFIRLSNNNLSRLDATNSGVDVYGFFTTTNNADIGGNVTCVALTETSDAKLKENVKEVNIKDCYKAVKYIKPKTYNFIKDEDKRSNLGMIADDIKDAKMPPEWDNIIYYNDDGIKLLAYNKLTVVLWGCVQQIIQEKDELLEMVKDMKKDITNLKREITKLKGK